MRLYEKRHEYSRTRMVQLSCLSCGPVASTAPTTSTETTSMRLRSAELDEGLASGSRSPRLPRSSRLDIGFCPLNAIERGVSDLIDARASHNVRARPRGDGGGRDVDARARNILIDCTGSKSLLRDHLTTAGTIREERTRSRSGSSTPSSSPSLRPELRLQRALQVLQETPRTRSTVHPMVNRTHYDGSVST